MLEDLERLDHLINQMLDAGRLDAERSKAEGRRRGIGGPAPRLRRGRVHELSRPARNPFRLDVQPNVVVGGGSIFDVILSQSGRFNAVNF